jgi:hypothetical protein
MNRRRFWKIGFCFLTACVPALFARGHDADHHEKHDGNRHRDDEAMHSVRRAEASQLSPAGSVLYE